MNAEITEEQIKEYAMGNGREDPMKQCANKYKKYMDAIDLMDRLSDDVYLRKDGMFSDLVQKTVVSMIGDLGYTVDSVMPDISNKYAAHLNKMLEKCPFTKEEALEWTKETQVEDTPTEPTHRGFCDWIKGLFR